MVAIVIWHSVVYRVFNYLRSKFVTYGTTGEYNRRENSAKHLGIVIRTRTHWWHHCLLRK